MGGLFLFAKATVGTFIGIIILVIVFIIGTFIGNILEVAIKNHEIPQDRHKKINQ